MAKGISIHIGLNRVDPNHYEGWDGELIACEFDAKDMQAIAQAKGFKSTLLLTKAATYAKVTQAIGQAATQLKAGDILLLTYSGHGGQLPDMKSEEADKLDETWVLYDRQLVDDELYYLWSLFQPGVRILMLSDSCHSGTISKMSTYKALCKEFSPNIQPRFRALPRDIQQKTYQAHRNLYDDTIKSYPQGDKVKISASVLLISGCLDNQLSSDGDKNGLFTNSLLKVWNQGKFTRGYYAFYKNILGQMPPWQSPNYFKVGGSNLQFYTQAPFTI